MSKERNASTDQIVEAEVAALIDESDDGTYTHTDLEDRVLDRLNVVDVESLKRDHVRQRIKSRDSRQLELARSSSQMGLPGDLAPPEGEFALGDGRRVPKDRAKDDHWVIHLRMLAEHASRAQASSLAAVNEYAAYSPYLRRGMTTGDAYDAYRRANPDAQAAD